MTDKIENNLRGGRKPSAYEAEIAKQGYASVPLTARIVGMSTTSVTRWLDDGTVRCVAVPQGNRRYAYAADVLKKVGEQLAQSMNMRAKFKDAGVIVGSAK